MMVASKTEDYQLLRGVLDQGPKEFRYSREDLDAQLFASLKQHVVDLKGPQRTAKGAIAATNSTGPLLGWPTGSVHRKNS